MFIATIATMVQLVEIIVEVLASTIQFTWDLFTVNCGKLCHPWRISLYAVREIATLGLALNYGIGSGIGWFLAILAIAAIREKIRYSAVPPALRGLELLLSLLV